jgi:hypothetical protein
VRALPALLVGAVSGVAGTLVHQQWWGLALALATGLVVLAWLPPGIVRLAFATGWCVPVVRGALERPAGGFLISSDAPGWSFIGGSFVLLFAALATLASGRGRAGDQGVRGPLT